ncbi:ABC transporter ATP-binding protein [Uliginosibacterium sp. H1]|uniref:ABC transporter ATP-binding protein n=1 Tax=Uliginosibacterium sp. H1 TaxID=3114757 RepID=UPI002E1955C1|nr:ABC transporter ATP-binding protein [Uliginosibacterium sp. H1]
MSSTATDIPAIRVRGAQKSYGSLQALAGVDLDIQQGEFFGLLGPNGAGKTTLISALAGLVRLSSGRISVMGHDVVNGYRDARRMLGVVPQELVFDPFFTVREMLRIQAGYFGLRNQDDWIDELLANLDLTSKANANMRALSGGMKRRVLVAQALVHKPPVIVLDEPTAGVDVELRQGLWAFIRKLNAAGHTIVLTTHYLEEAETLCNRIAMLKAGRVIELDTTANLLRRLRSHALRVTFGAPLELPTALRDRTPVIDGLSYCFAFDDYAEVEPLLAALRQAGGVPMEIEVVKPDLEQVFVDLVNRD